MKKSFFKRIATGIKEGWARPQIPLTLQKLENSIFISIFKLFGYVSLSLSMSKFNLPSPLNEKPYFYLIKLLTITFILYRLIIVIFTLKGLFQELIEGKFLVRNSPMDVLGTIFKGSLKVLTSTANISIGAGFTYALCHELDNVLQSEGKNPYFVPGIKKTISYLHLEDGINKTLKKVGITDAIENNDSNSILNSIDSLSDEDKLDFYKSTGVTFEKFKECLSHVSNNHNKSTSAQIQKLIEEEDPFKFNTK